MPLSINVGLSRKASKDYQFTGVSINVTAELDQSLLGRPEELQQQIENLYAQAQHALEQRVGFIPDHPQRSNPAPNPANGRSTGHNGNGNGHGNGNGNSHARNKGSAMTDSERRAILAISRRVNVDPAQEARDIIGVEFDNLTLRQASQFIDHLKDLQPTEGNGS